MTYKKYQIGCVNILKNKVQYLRRCLGDVKVLLMMTAVTGALICTLMSTVGFVPGISRTDSVDTKQVALVDVKSDIEVSSIETESKIEEIKVVKKSRTAGMNSRSKVLAALRNRKTNRGISNRVNYNPLGINRYTADEYDVMLRNTGLKGCGKYFKEMESLYGVNALFAIAVAGLESGNGFKPMSGNNYFGMVGMEFKNKRSNILYFGKLISGRLYKGAGRTTLVTIGDRYSASDLWPSKIETLMKEYAKKI